MGNQRYKIERQRKERVKPDLVLLGVVLVLALWGIFALGTATFPLSLDRFGTAYYYFFHQGYMFLAGIILGYLLYKLPIEKIKKYSFALFLINLFLLFLVFAPKIGVTSKGAVRWLNIFGFTLQPSEFLKFSFLLYLSAWISVRAKTMFKKREKTKKQISELLFPFIIMLGVLMLGLFLQRDITTLLIILLTAMAVYFFSPAPFWHTIVLVCLGVVILGAFIAVEPYRLHRITTYLNPGEDPMDKGWQIKQAAIAIGSGKIIGVNDGLGLGMSRQKFGFLPESQTDSIFAIIAEEGGFVGAFILIALFLVFCQRGFRVALYHRNEFQGFLAFGITFWITSQAFYNIAGITAILPLGGVPLPFFSYGGSHLIAEFMAMGVLLNISKSND
ncbi:putative lipid II flippase FtsW [Candidatus Parcubacteria bacterium]|nr:putative lipid II flippase FtsW [Candidatus Parcubacteria bacterium]